MTACVLRCPLLSLGFLASNAGSAMRAILSAISCGDLAATAKLLVVNNPKATALTIASASGVPTLCLPTIRDPQAADIALAKAMSEAKVDLIILSGYLRRLGPVTLNTFQNRILNIHPGPLPEFGGEGMYGRRVHQAVLQSGATMSGICVHLVDEIYDHGSVLNRKIIAVRPTDLVEDLERRVTEAEPRFFVETLGEIIAGRLALPGDLQTKATHAKSAS